MPYRILVLFLAALGAVTLSAQDSPAETVAPKHATPKVETPAEPEAAPKPVPYVISSGTHVPLSLINSVSTKNASEGDRVYLESVYPVMAQGRIVIPAGSYVSGTVTHLKRAGRVKGRAELYVRFDSLTLPNGVTRDFHASISNLDGRSSETLDKDEGKIKGEGNKSGDMRTIAESAGAGAGIGGLAGAAARHPGMGAGIGVGAGAAAGLIGVLLSRGPDAVLARGTGMEMVLDRPLEFTDEEIHFDSATLAHRPVNDGNGPMPSVKNQRQRLPGRGWPF